ncbi:MAG: DHHW family protein [Bacteroides sp.]|nr:DHHW family protein [Bacteroides sp.]
MDWEKFEAQQNRNEISYYSNPNAQEKASILLVGDSFRAAMIPVLRETFLEVYVVHRSYYTADLLDEINPEYLLAEYVERYSADMEDIEFLIR